MCTVLTVTTSKANNFCHITLWLMKMHRNTMFSDKRFSGSEDTIGTKHRHMDRQTDTVIPIYPPNFVNRGRGGGRRRTCNTGWSECRHRSQRKYRLRFYRDTHLLPSSPLLFWAG